MTTKTYSAMNGALLKVRYCARSTGTRATQRDHAQAHIPRQHHGGQQHHRRHDELRRQSVRRRDRPRQPRPEPLPEPDPRERPVRDRAGSGVFDKAHDRRHHRHPDRDDEHAQVPVRAVHAAATRMMIGASMLPIHDWAACHWKSCSKTRNVWTTPSAVPATSRSPSHIHSPGRQRNRSTAIWTRTPSASGSTMSSRGAIVRARLSGSKKTDVATRTTSPTSAPPGPAHRPREATAGRPGCRRRPRSARGTTRRPSPPRRRSRSPAVAPAPRTTPRRRTTRPRPCPSGSCLSR